VYELPEYGTGYVFETHGKGLAFEEGRVECCAEEGRVVGYKVLVYVEDERFGRFSGEDGD